MPVPTKIKKNIGVSGPANVKVLRDSVRVTYADGGIYEVEKEGFGDRPSGNYNVTLTQDGSKILFLQPPGGITALVKFDGFGNRKYATEEKKDAGIPEAYIKRGGPRKGKNRSTWIAQDELTFSNRLTIVDDSPYKGLSIPYSLPYAFELYPGTQIAMIATSDAKLGRIQEFFRVAGFDLNQQDNSIPMSDNVLPWLENRLFKSNKIFSVTLNKDGYVSAVT